MTQSEFGGAQRFIYTFTTNLKGYDIIVGAGPEGDDKKGLLFALEKRGIKIVHLKNFRRSINPFFDLMGLIEAFRLIKKLKPDVVFVNSTKAGILGGLSARLLKIKRIIYRIGGWTFNDPWPKWKKKLYILIEKYTAKFKDFIVNNAGSDRKQAIRLGIKPKKEIILIHNGIGELEFLSKENARKFLKIKPGFTIGTIANFYPPKGLKFLIRAANILKKENINFVVIGDGEERKKLEDLIKECKLDNFFLTGVIPEASKYLKAFDIFVLPSVKEGFPWTVLEAMMANVPIIVTKVGAVPDVVENNKDGFVIEPGNPKELAKTIKELVENKELREKFVKGARKTVQEKFALKQMIKKYEDLFFIN